MKSILPFYFFISALILSVYGEQTIIPTINPSVKLIMAGEFYEPHILIGQNGTVEIFKRTKEGTWDIIQTLQGNHPSFGQSLSGSHQALIIGAPTEERPDACNGTATGNIYVYLYNKGRFEQISNGTIFQNISNLPCNNFGYAVDIEAESYNAYYLAVGSVDPQGGTSQLFLLKETSGYFYDNPDEVTIKPKWNYIEQISKESGQFCGLDVSRFNTNTIGTQCMNGETFNQRPSCEYYNSTSISNIHPKSIDTACNIFTLSTKDKGIKAFFRSTELPIQTKDQYIEAGKEITATTAYAIFHYIATVNIKDLDGSADLIIYELKTINSNNETSQSYSELPNKHTFTYNRNSLTPGKSTSIMAFDTDTVGENINPDNIRILVAVYDEKTQGVQILEIPNNLEKSQNIKENSDIL